MAYNTYATSPIHQKLSDKTVSGSILAKFAADEDLMRNVSKTVNRTWVYGTPPTGVAVDSNQCSHVADRLWLLGTGNVNCTGRSNGTRYQPDADYDTSKFTGKFTPEIQMYITPSDQTRVKYRVNSDGTTGSSAGFWWLRSANSSYGNFVGFVYSGGYVSDNDADDTYGCSPAFVLG